MTYKEYDEEVKRAKEFLRKASEPKEFFVCWTWYLEDQDDEIIECTHEDNVHYQYYYHIDACNASEAKKKIPA